LGFGHSVIFAVPVIPPGGSLPPVILLSLYSGQLAPIPLGSRRSAQTDVAPIAARETDREDPMRYRQFAVGAMLALAASTSALAGWNEWWNGTKVVYRRNNEWPYPFVCADRMAVQHPLELMAHNGWRRENTLGNELFDAETGALTRAGMIKVKWTVTQAPVQRRSVFVLRAETPEATAARVDAVQQAIAKILPEGPMPEVAVTDTPPAGVSGDYLDAIDRSMRSTVPAPRLPAMAAPTDQ
jgi:hypothetical protein